jgi:hypothetical protein
MSGKKQSRGFIGDCAGRSVGAVRAEAAPMDVTFVGRLKISSIDEAVARLRVAARNARESSAQMIVFPRAGDVLELNEAVGGGQPRRSLEPRNIADPVNTVAASLGVI